MRKYPGLCNRRSGMIHCELQELSFYLEGETIPHQRIAFSNLSIRDVGKNSSIYLFEDKQKPTGGFSCSEKAILEELSARGIHSAKGLLSSTSSKQMKRLQVALGVTFFCVFSLIAIPLIFFKLSDSYLDRVITREQEERLLSSLSFTQHLETLERKESRALNALLDFLSKENPEIKKLDLKLSVVRMDVSNAFAFAGNRIMFTDKLLQEVGSAEELTGILGHEIGHVHKRHVLKTALGQMGLFSGILALQLFVGQEVASVASLGANVGSLTFSRSFEEAADDYSYQLLRRSGVSLNGFLGFFERLSAEEGASSAALSLLRTHPLSSERLRKLKDKIDRNPLTFENPIPISLEDLRR